MAVVLQTFAQRFSFVYRQTFNVLRKSFNVRILIGWSSHAMYKERPTIGDKSVPNIIINDAIIFFPEIATSILVISNRNSFRVRFDKIVFVYFI